MQSHELLLANAFDHLTDDDRANFSTVHTFGSQTSAAAPKGDIELHHLEGFSLVDK